MVESDSALATSLVKPWGRAQQESGLFNVGAQARERHPMGEESDSDAVEEVRSGLIVEGAVEHDMGGVIEHLVAVAAAFSFS